MFTVKFQDKEFFAEENALLSDVLIKNGVYIEHSCGGIGICRKCTVTVDGKEELSCKYIVKSDITVDIPDYKGILSETGAHETSEITENMCFCLDIGTTTLALALVSLDNKETVKVVTATNPQRKYGADVISRIDFCRKNSVSPLNRVLINKINALIEAFGVDSDIPLFVSGNTTMLHTFFSADCSSLGVAPYTPVFLESKEYDGDLIGLKGVSIIKSLPCIHSFFGADLVAGINYTGLPQDESYYLLVDLGTNAEIALYSRDKILCTSAAAGPCFEGGNILCGMSATEGAIYRFSLSAIGGSTYKTIGNTQPKGICGTGLIDIIDELITYGFIDESGFMESEAYDVAENVTLSQKDVRQFQLAKSAVYSAIFTLLKEARINLGDVSKIFISGGFSAEIDINSAFGTRLLPNQPKEKFVTLNNSSLLGTIKYALEENDASEIIKKATYTDLSDNPVFTSLFMDNMEF